jgi:hypothetical protein
MGVWSARGVDEHRLTRSFEEKGQRVVADAQPAQAAALEGDALGAGPEEGAWSRGAAWFHRSGHAHGMGIRAYSGPMVAKPISSP